MVSHESFWVAVAAAAPVIALANTVTITDPISVYFDARKQSKVKTVYTLTGIVVISSFTLVAQALIMASALFSLLSDKDEISPRVAIAVLTLGLIYVLENVLASIFVRRMYYGGTKKKKKEVVTRGKNTSSKEKRVPTGLGWPNSMPSRSVSKDNN